MGRGMVFLLSILSFNADASVYQMGQVWPVKEKSLLVYLQERAQHIDMDAFKEAQRQRAKAYLEHPNGISLPRASHSRTYSFIPQTKAYSDIKDEKGSVIIKAGTTINVLERLPLYTLDMVFFDANDKAQMRFMKGLTFSDNAKWIVVSGNYMLAKKELERPLYFDQQGKMITHFGIKHLPARIHRVGNELKIDEIAIKESAHAS